MSDNPPAVQRWLDENFVPWDDDFIKDLDLMRLGYMRALLWNETVTVRDDDGLNDEENDEEVALETLFNTYELSGGFSARCRREVWAFVQAMHPNTFWRRDPDMAGIDLWLTRQRTGAGFGDGDWDLLTGESGVGRMMYDVTHRLFPHEAYVYVHDGELYFS